MEFIHCPVHLPYFILSIVITRFNYIVGSGTSAMSRPCWLSLYTTKADAYYHIILSSPWKSHSIHPTHTFKDIAQVDETSYSKTPIPLSYITALNICKSETIQFASSSNKINYSQFGFLPTQTNTSVIANHVYHSDRRDWCCPFRIYCQLFNLFRAIVTSGYFELNQLYPPSMLTLVNMFFSCKDLSN